VERKRQLAMTKTKRVSVSQCPICYVESPPREHLVRHFMEELLEIVENEIGGGPNCDRCEYK
jgi:hypothetical protein